MNLRHLGDDELLFETKKLAREEWGILTKLLWHIKEVERRRLFSKLKLKSINVYVENELGYSNDEAWRRVAAARVLQEVPEIEHKINSGKLNLTNIGLARALFQKEKREANHTFSKSQKIEILDQISGKTTREAAKIVWSHSTLPVPEFRERVRVLTDELCEYNFAADSETQQDIERLKGLLAHSHPSMSVGQLVKKLCKLGLREWDPAMKTDRRKKYIGSESSIATPQSESKIAAPRLESGIAAPQLEPKIAAPRSEPMTSSNMTLETQDDSEQARNSQSLSKARQTSRDESSTKAEQSRQTWRNARSQCTNCGSCYALQEDHKYPKAKGGNDSPENKRLLCRTCNQRAAIEHFGIKIMDPYLNKTPR